jgi:hypothetical protein
LGLVSAPDEDDPEASLEAALIWWEIHRHDQV